MKKKKKETVFFSDVLNVPLNLPLLIFPASFGVQAFFLGILFNADAFIISSPNYSRVEHVNRGKREPRISNRNI